MNTETVKRTIENGRAVLGIELGSTRIKAVLIGEDNAPIASGGFAWENRLENGVWTYHLDDVWTGVAASYKELADNVKNEFGVTIKSLAAIGFSAMMHGYLVFDKNGEQLVPFRTWRNTMTADAAAELTKTFSFNIPQRWSIAHLYQAVLNGEEHLSRIDLLTTLAGYIHFKLTGRRVLGVGEASGVFPINSKTNDYNAGMVARFDGLIRDEGFAWTLRDILPSVLNAGEDAGALTPEGAKLLDPSGQLEAGIPLCPPEGDAGTGMVATNSVAERTGNVSAGTSIFAMAVLEKEMAGVYPEIDMVTTPTGKPVAMVHCNNCSSDIDAWVALFGDVTEAFGKRAEKSELYDALYKKALEGDADCGGLMNYNYFSGEPITNLDKGCPLFLRLPDCSFSLANFMRAQLNSALATLRIGMNILFKKEKVRLEQLMGHGGFFKTEIVGQRLMAAALNVPVTVMKTAGEGGAWGIALLASYLVNKNDGQTLEDYLSTSVFANNEGSTLTPDKKDIEGFDSFMKLYENGLSVERAAVELIK